MEDIKQLNASQIESSEDIAWYIQAFRFQPRPYPEVRSQYDIDRDSPHSPSKSIGVEVAHRRFRRKVRGMRMAMLTVKSIPVCTVKQRWTVS